VIIYICVEVIVKHNIIFIEELISFIPISKGTFYAWKLNEMDLLKDAIEVGKVKQKSHMRTNWYASDNPTLQLACYRLLAKDEEHRRLNTNYTDVTTQGEKINAPVLITMDEAKKRLADLENEI